MRYLLLFGLFVSLFGCGSLEKKYDKKEIENVKRIAVLSFTLYQDKPADNLGLSSLAKGVSVDSTSENSPEMKALAKDVYLYLSKNLQAGLGKRVQSLSEMKNSNLYKSYYKEKMTGMRMGGYQGKDVELVFVDGIVDQTNFQGADFAKKVALAKSVGADAFIEFSAFQSIEQG